MSKNGIVTIVAQLYTFTKSNWNISLQWVYFVVYKLTLVRLFKRAGHHVGRQLMLSYTNKMGTVFQFSHRLPAVSWSHLHTFIHCPLLNRSTNICKLCCVGRGVCGKQLSFKVLSERNSGSIRETCPLSAKDADMLLVSSSFMVRFAQFYFVFFLISDFPSSLTWLTSPLVSSSLTTWPGDDC